MTPDLLKDATEVIMAAITRQLEDIRGEKAPKTPYDPKRERIEQRRRTAAAVEHRRPDQHNGALREEERQEEGQGK
jgi:hypothetical protein